MARLSHDDRRDGGFTALAFLLAVALPVIFSPRAEAMPALAPVVDVGLTERIVLDRQSGVALFGYDPVAYFTDRKPTVGSPEHELVWNGAAWRFANEGNLAAFKANPMLYAPRFGGYDAEAVARGVATAGNPRVFVVSAEGLLLFRDAESLRHFAGSPDALTRSEEAWTRLESRLVH